MLLGDDLADEDVVVIRRAPSTRTHVYAIRFGSYIKVGMTTDVAQRMRALPGAILKPSDLDRSDVEPLCAVPGGADVERLVHTLLAEERAIGEWFYATPRLVAAFRSMMSDETRTRTFQIPAEGETYPVPVDF